MRCPKCGYISFDHLEFCLKCKKDISAVSDVLQGAVLSVTPPLFLNLQPQDEVSDENDLVTDGEVFEDEDAEGDFDISLEDESFEEDEEVFSLEGEQDEGEDIGVADFEISADEEQDTEITIDPSLFDDDVEDGDQVFGNQSDNPSEEDTEDFEIEMPQELHDISDLSAPIPPEADSSEGEDFFNIDLGNFDFDLDNEVVADAKPVELADGEEELSLSDIDFSDTISGPKDKEKKKASDMNMDEDLNFDLDLGGLSIHDDNI